MVLKLKLEYFGHLMGRVESLKKTLMLGGIGDRRRIKQYKNQKKQKKKNQLILSVFPLSLNYLLNCNELLYTIKRAFG